MLLGGSMLARLAWAMADEGLALLFRETNVIADKAIKVVRTLGAEAEQVWDDDLVVSLTQPTSLGAFTKTVAILAPATIICFGIGSLGAAYMAIQKAIEDLEQPDEAIT